MEPADNSYATFYSGKIALLGGSCTVTFEGLNPSSAATSVILIDSVTLSGVNVANGSFEIPHLDSDQVAPVGAVWSFLGPAGIAAKDGDYSDPDTPYGDQVAFVSNHGSISQTVNNLPAGDYLLSFKAAQFSGNRGNQRLRLTFRTPASESSVKTFVWCGDQICEERNGHGATVQKRFFAKGEQRLTGADAGIYYYTRDHLGSIREVTNSAGAVVARYDYDPYGNRVVLSGVMNFDFGYTGHYYHAQSGLNLTYYRVYDPKLGRWLSRDPVGEKAGPNLYDYVMNDPLGRIDPDGLFWGEFAEELGKSYVRFGKGAESYFSDLGAGFYELLALNGAFGREEQVFAEENAAIIQNALRLASKCPNATGHLIWELLKHNPERLAGRASSGILLASALRIGVSGASAPPIAASPLSVSTVSLTSYGAATNLILTGRQYAPEELVRVIIGGYFPEH